MGGANNYNLGEVDWRHWYQVRRVATGKPRLLYHRNDGDCTLLLAMSSLPQAFRSHDWVGRSLCYVCLCNCVAAEACASCVSVYQCSHGYGSWNLCQCAFYVCVWQWTRVHLAHLSYNWETCPSVAVKPTQFSAPSAGLGGVPPSSSQRQTMWCRSADSSSAPFGRVSKEGAECHGLDLPRQWSWFHSGIKVRCCLFQCRKQNQSQNYVSRSSFPCKVVVCYIGRG